MSILLETDSGWIISHHKYFDRLKVEVGDSTKVEDNKKGNSATTNGGEKDATADSGESGKSAQYFRRSPQLFEIIHPFKPGLKAGKAIKDKDRVGSSKLELGETSKLVKQLSEEILSHPEARSVFRDEEPLPVRNDASQKNESGSEKKNDGKGSTNNCEAVTATRTFFDTVKDIRWPQFFGHNPDPELSIISEVKGCSSGRDGGDSHPHHFIFPPGSRFYCNNVSEMKNIFGAGMEDEEKFDLVVVDSSWWNKFIRRKKRKQHEAGYDMITNSEIAAIPIKNILKEDGVVVVWCTNARSNQDAVLQKIFPAWGIEFSAMLHWLKVMKSGVPICPFNAENKKQPYEAIIIGSRKNDRCRNSSSALTESKVLISVPSSINSHKPPLIEVLKRLYPQKNFLNKLEVFARYLTPDFTCFGNEVIKLQHISLFEKI